MPQKTYLFLEDDIYSPDEQTGVRGKEVIIDKTSGNEIHFHVKGSKKKGYVVYPHLFAENTNENRKKIRQYKNKMAESERLSKEASALFETIKGETAKSLLVALNK